MEREVPLANICYIEYVPIELEWPKIMFNISPELQGTPGIFPKNHPS